MSMHTLATKRAKNQRRKEHEKLMKKRYGDEACAACGKEALKGSDKCIKHISKKNLEILKASQSHQGIVSSRNKIVSSRDKAERRS